MVELRLSTRNMTYEKQDKSSPLQPAILRISRIHFLFVLAYALNIVVADSWNLIPPEAALARWTGAGALLAVNTTVWYFSRFGGKAPSFYRCLVFMLILSNIIVASYTVYVQRGMASQAVALFAIPIIMAAVLRSRAALIATASLSTAAYVLAAVRYFILHPGEGYKVELYGEVAFYCTVFFILAVMCAVIFRSDST